MFLLRRETETIKYMKSEERKHKILAEKSEERKKIIG